MVRGEGRAARGKGGAVGHPPHAGAVTGRLRPARTEVTAGAPVPSAQQLAFASQDAAVVRRLEEVVRDAAGRAVVHHVRSRRHHPSPPRVHLCRWQRAQRREPCRAVIAKEGVLAYAQPEALIAHKRSKGAREPVGHHDWNTAGGNGRVEA